MNADADALERECRRIMAADSVVYRRSPAMTLMEKQHSTRIRVNGDWCDVDWWIFRSWAGDREFDGQPYDGPRYALGKTEVSKCTSC